MEKIFQLTNWIVATSNMGQIQRTHDKDKSAHSYDSLQFTFIFVTNMDYKLYQK